MQILCNVEAQKRQEPDGLYYRGAPHTHTQVTAGRTLGTDSRPDSRKWRLMRASSEHVRSCVAMPSWHCAMAGRRDTPQLPGSGIWKEWDSGNNFTVSEHGVFVIALSPILSHLVQQ